MSGNEDVAGVKPFARPLSLDYAGIPIKKRRFLRCPSPPPEEQSPEPVQKDALQKGQSTQSEKLSDSSVGKAVSTLLASDAIGSFVPKEMEGICAELGGYNTVKVEPSAVGCSARKHMVSENSLGVASSTLLASEGTCSFVLKKMQEACSGPNGPSGYDTVKVEPSAVLSAIPDKEAKHLVSEKSGGVASSVVNDGLNSRLGEFFKERSDDERDKGSVLIKSKTLGNPDLSLGLVEKCISSLEDGPSAVGCSALSVMDKEAKHMVSEKSLGVDSNTLLASKGTCSFVPKEVQESCSGPNGPSGYNAVKIEPSAVTALCTIPDKEAKLVVSEKSVGVASSVVNDGLNSRLCEFLKERSDERRDKGSVLIMLKTLGNHDLSLGLEEKHISSPEDRKSYNKSGVCRSIETVSLNLSLSNEEIHDGCPDTAVNRSNWDLNTTMDAWEDSEKDAAIHSKPISESHEVKPSISSAEAQETCFNYISNQLHESDCRSRTGDTISQTVERPLPETSLNLQPSPAMCSLNIGQEPSSSSIDKQPGSLPSLPSFLAHSNASKAGSGIVKHEPIDEGLRPDSGCASSRALHSPKSTGVKVELIRKPGSDVLRSFHCSSIVNSIAPGSIKPEVLHEPSPRMSETAKASSIQCDKSVVDSRGQSTSSANELKHPNISALDGCQPLDKQVLECHDMVGKSDCSPVLSVAGDIPEDFRDNRTSGSPHSMELAKTVGEGGDTVSSPKHSHCGHVRHKFVVHGMTEIATVEKKNTNSIDELNHQVHPLGDEEKICSSHELVEEECSEPEYESDGNSVPMDIEEDGQRCDGVKGDVGIISEVNKNDIGVISEVNKNDIVDGTSGELQGQHIHSGLHPKAIENPSGDLASVSDIFKSPFLEEERTEDSHGDVTLEEPCAIQMPPGGADEGASFMTSQQEIPIMSGEALNDLGTAHLSNQAHSEGQESSITVVQDSDENAKLNNVDQNYLQLPKEKVSLGDDSTKDPSTGVQRSRIINLSRASTETTPSKTSPIGSYARERLPDGPLEGDRPHPRERNDLCYNEGFRRFPWGGHQDRRNYQMNYARDRRLSDGNNPLPAARTSESNFVPELRNCLSEYGVPKNKYVAAAAVAAVAAAGTDTKYVNHNVANDVFIGAGRGRRKVVDDETDNFHRLSSRRRSPSGRDASSGIQMARRVSRNFNEDGGEGVGLRRSANFMRGIHADGGERPYSRNQRPYEGVDSHFGHGARNILSVQKRSLPRFHSKSPIRSRSPGPWPSSKKRSPDAFDGPSDLPHRGSPRICRMDMMRSPDHVGFPSEVVTKRHGSPTFFSRANESRDLDSSHDHVHSRSLVSRGPTSRVAFRNNRRFGAGIPRDRTDNDQFVTRPMHSGRFHEVSRDDIESMRCFAERRGPVRSFRAAFNDSNKDNYPVSTEDRPLRFCRGDDQQFQGRVNLSGRPFERGTNRSVNARRRPIGVEDEEGDYTRQGIYDDDQDGMSRLRKKRF